MIARSPLVKQLTEATSIATAEKIQHSAIATPLQADPIKTAYVKQGDNPSASPILLLHGFDSSLLEFRRLMPQLDRAERERLADPWFLRDLRELLESPASLML